MISRENHMMSRPISWNRARKRIRVCRPHALQREIRTRRHRPQLRHRRHFETGDNIGDMPLRQGVIAHGQRFGVHRIKNSGCSISAVSARSALAFTRRDDGAITACIMVSAAFACPAAVMFHHGVNTALNISVWNAKHASAQAICFSTTIFTISALEAAVGDTIPHQMIGIRRAMVSAAAMLVS